MQLIDHSLFTINVDMDSSSILFVPLKYFSLVKWCEAIWSNACSLLINSFYFWSLFNSLSLYAFDAIDGVLGLRIYLLPSTHSFPPAFNVAGDFGSSIVTRIRFRLVSHLTFKVSFFRLSIACSILYSCPISTSWTTGVMLWINSALWFNRATPISIWK